MIPREKDFLKQVLTPKAFQVFHHSGVFDKLVFCLGEKQGMYLVNECILWHNKVEDFKMSVWDRRKEVLHGNGLVGEIS